LSEALVQLSLSGVCVDGAAIGCLQREGLSYFPPTTAFFNPSEKAPKPDLIKRRPETARRVSQFSFLGAKPTFCQARVARIYLNAPYIDETFVQYYQFKPIHAFDL
jgi:hypothetical protein